MLHHFIVMQKGQLGRVAPQSDAGEGSSRGRCPWYSVPGLVPGVGPRLGRRATWVGASADVTYIKLDQSLINTHNLSASAVVANSNCLGEKLCHVFTIVSFSIMKQKVCSLFSP